MQKLQCIDIDICTFIQNYDCLRQERKIFNKNEQQVLELNARKI